MIPTELGDLLEQCLDVLERSQAILERSLAMESALSRLAEGQEELRRMILAMVNGTTPASTNIQNPAVKNEEDDEVEMVELPSATPASPAEGDDDISSVSSVISEEDIDHMDSSSVHDLEGGEKNPPERPTCGDLPVPHSVTRSFSSGQESEEEDDGASSMSSEDEPSTSGEETDLDDEDTGRKGSDDASAPNRYISEVLAVWKCAVCGRLIKGDWHNRQHHIESHEELRLSCPVTGCSARRRSQNFASHLRVHKTAKGSLPVEQRAELQRQLDSNKQKAMECEMKYFPPSSLVSFAETSGRNTVNLACKKCGKICVELRTRRDHVGTHVKAKIRCPFHDCRYSGRVFPMYVHIRNTHKKNLQKLTKEQRRRFEESRRKFCEQVDAVMEDYFS